MLSHEDELCRQGLQLYMSDKSDDHTKAVDLFSEAAASSCTNGIYNLAVAYYAGKGINQDKNEAARLWKLGSESPHNHSRCQFCFGCMIELGEVEGDAEKYWKMAASQGHTGAKRRLNHLIPPQELLGKRLHVIGMGIGQVVGFEKGYFMGKGPSRHSIQFDLPSTHGLKKVILQRHNNGGRTFDVMDDVHHPNIGNCSTTSAFPAQVHNEFDLQPTVERTNTGGGQKGLKGLTRLPTNQEAL